MADQTTHLAQIAQSQAQKEVTANGLFDAGSIATYGGRRAEACSGLTWGYYGGRVGGTTVANGTLTLQANATNYVVAVRSTGVIMLAEDSPAEWFDTATYARLYRITTGTLAVTDYQDHRLGSGGVLQLLQSGGVQLDEANSFTAAQVVVPVALTDGASIATDAALSNTFRVTLGGNRTLANPSNLANGGIYTWRITQDGTGGRTLAYGSKFKFPGGSTPVLTGSPGAVDLITGQYFSDTDTILCSAIYGLA